MLGTLDPAAAAALVTAAGTAGAGAMGAINAWRKRRDEARRMEAEEDSIVITQAQGANLILDATVKMLNTQLDRERLRADKAEERVEVLEARAERAEAEASTAGRALIVARGQLADLRGER